MLINPFMRTTPFVSITLIVAALFSNGGCTATGSRSNEWSTARQTTTDAQTADLQMAFGRIFEARGDLEHAMAAYRQAARHTPYGAEAYLRMAVLHDKLGQFAQAAAMYRDAIRLDPGNPEIFADVGFSLYLQERWEDAEMNLRQALAIHPQLQRAHNNLALVLARTDRIEEALAEFHRGGCEWTDAHANVAFVMATQGKHQLAQMHHQLAQSRQAGQNVHLDVKPPRDERVPILFPPIGQTPEERSADGRDGGSVLEHALADRPN